MRLARCEKGHYYDKDKFTQCPHCNGMQIAPGETVAFEDPNKPKEEPKEEAPKVEVEERVAFSVDEAKSESNYDKKAFIEEVAAEEVKEEAVEPEEDVSEADTERLDEMTTIVIEEEKPAKKEEPKKEEVKPEPVKEELKPEEPKKEEPKPEPVKEEIKVEEPVEVINITATKAPEAEDKETASPSDRKSVV